jgi:non-specific serine/threonine protein kinase
MSSGTSTPAPAAPLIGRASEVEDVLGLLGRARIVTLTGPPGVGKTRLAQAVCAERDDLAVVWVDLAPLRDPSRVHTELVRALAPGEGGDGDRLLVLDNCEHLLDTDPDLGSEVVELLASSPRLQVLATSRERLRLAAEREYAVPPLPMPSADDAADPARLRHNPAVRLLLDRAPAAVTLTPNTARALAEICIDLDGLPLAIELAAARLRVFTPSELAFRLGRRMSVLTSGPRDSPARHRDLRAAIAWSHDLLSERDRAAFRRLSVFPGEWDLESAEAVCGVPDFVDVLESLIDKSLVRRAGADLDGPARFTMLMSLREYAAEQLDEQDEARETGDRHALWFARRSREWEATVGTTAETDTWPELAIFRADLDVALSHARATDQGELVVWLATALAWFGYTRGVLAEAQLPLAELSAAADDDLVDPDARPAGRLAAGVTAYGLGRFELAEELLAPFSTVEGVVEEAPEERRGAVARAFLGHLARERGDLAEAAALYTATRAAHVRLGNVRGTAWAGHDLALLALAEGRTDEAEELLSESLELFDSIGYDWAAAVCACLLASAVVGRAGAADVDRAATLLARALRLHDASGDRRGIAQCLEVVAEVALARGAAATAARLVGAADAGRRRAASLATELELRRLVDLGRRLDSTLGRAAAERERHAGRTMPPSAVLELAGRMVEGATAGATVVELTARQLEVAALVAEGHTNRQIGKLLGISEKTTEVHVHNLMTRLETPSRAGVAAWAAARGLVAQPAP